LFPGADAKKKAKESAMSSVELYATHACVYCQRIREALTERNVDFVEYNVEDDAGARERMIRLSRHTTVPTVVVGDEVMVGFDPERLRELLG
jgi:glutaredoxin-like YruB-family protein